MGTISANTSLHGTTTVRFLNDIYANGTITAAGNVKASGDIISTKNGVVKLETAPMGEIYFTDNSTITTIATATVFVKAAGVTTFDPNSMQFGTSNTNNRLVYTGTSTKIFHVAMTASYSSLASNKTIGIAIAKNGTTTGMEKSIIKDFFVSGDTVQSSAIHVMPVLNQNDYLEVFATNFDAIGTVTVKTLNMFAMGMSNGND
ncbi:MAG TPA: hypothetical protein ACFYEF_08555 [Candidatus Wunengus sp. YC63]|uniref:hypothetical protein n=1 Tax=unclassified Candidatus Wunengus TaxID=3367695 RepID=UPI0040270A7F